MGLLEKAQIRKQQLEESELIQEEPKEELSEKPTEESQGLLAKAQQRIQTKEQLFDIRPGGKQGIEVIEEEQRCGYKKLGSRRIVFDHNINEYRYEVIEPELNETEKRYCLRNSDERTRSEFFMLFTEIKYRAIDLISVIVKTCFKHATIKNSFWLDEEPADDVHEDWVESRQKKASAASRRRKKKKKKKRPSRGRYGRFKKKRGKRRR